MLREVAGNYVVVAVGKAADQFNGLINLNGTGAFLWKQLEKSSTKEELLMSIMKKYEVDENAAATDVDEFLMQIREGNFVE